MSVFSPVTITTSNFLEDFILTAREQGANKDELDFDILSYATFCRESESDEWQFVESTKLTEHFTESTLRNPDFEIYQQYELRIRPSEEHPLFRLAASIATDKTKSKTALFIDPSSLFPLKKGIQEWLRDEIYKKLIRSGLMIGVYDQNLSKEINRLLLKIQKEGPLTETYKLPIGEFLPPELPVDDKVLLHFKENAERKSLIEGVQIDDLIFEYFFPKEGLNGRACNGEHIPVREPNRRYGDKLLIDTKTIRSEEDAYSIRFYAKVSGFVERRKGMFMISQELQIESATFKNTGSIETGIDKEVLLKVKRNTATEDAIGSGVNIDVQKLDVSGTVGSHSKIQACDVNIGAQTHKKSEISVTENATIHLHRGHLKAKEAIINILETGKVEAQIVRAEKMVGGEIIADEVYIGTLYSNATITALKRIEIDKIEGEGNNLIIDPHSIELYHKKIAELETTIHSQTSYIQEKNRELLIRQHSFNDKYSRIKVFQDRISEAKKLGIQPMKADMARILQYRQDLKDLQNCRTMLHDEETKVHNLREELSKLYDADMFASVVHHSEYNGLNRVTFIDPRTHQEYSLTPSGRIRTIRLQIIDEKKHLLLEN